MKSAREEGVYERYLLREFCTPGGSYFVYSVFPGVMLACWRCTPKSLFQTCNSFH